MGGWVVRGRPWTGLQQWVGHLGGRAVDAASYILDDGMGAGRGKDIAAPLSGTLKMRSVLTRTRVRVRAVT